MAKNGMGARVVNVDEKSIESYVTYKKPEEVTVEREPLVVEKVEKPKVSLGRPSVFNFITKKSSD